MPSIFSRVRQSLSDPSASAGRRSDPVGFSSRTLLTIGCALLLPGTLAFAGCGDRTESDAARFNDGFCSVGTAELNTAFDHWYHRLEKSQGRPGGPVPATQDAPKAIHEGRGNATAPGALLRGVCDLAPMSRPMNDSEIDAFVKKFGAPPVAVPVALEALAIIVPAGSHVREVTREQVHTIFHETPHALEDLFPYIADTPHQGRKLDAFGVNSASDRYRWFRLAVLDGDAVSDRVVEVPGPLELVDRVGASRHAFGYARPAELTERVKDLPVDGVRASERTAASGSYPYTRYLYVYLPPRHGDRPNVEAVSFLRFVLSDEQQAMLRPLGLYPLSDEDRARALALLN